MVHEPQTKKRSGWKIYPFWTKLMFAISRKHTRQDFKIAILFPEKDQKSVAFLKIDQALDLISQYDPDRYRDVQCDVKRIWVSATAGYRAQWDSELRMCTLDYDYFFSANPSPAEIAVSIVHEATHAHLDKLGIENTFESQVHIERLCAEAEIAFARRLPDGEPLIKDAEARLELPESFWTKDASLERLLDTAAEMGKKGLLSRCLYRALKWYVGKKQSRD